jgi:AraC-like DNA-binding protein
MAHRAARVKEVRFHNPRLAKVGVEVLSVGALLRREGPKLLGSPQRVDFYHLLLVEFGRARHMVDFVEYDLRPGSVMLVRPGEVQQWRMREGVQGQLVLISSEALTPTVPRSNRDMRLLSLNVWPTVSRPTRILFEEAKADVARLASDAERFEGTDLEAAIIRHQLLSLLLRMARELRLPTTRRAINREAEIHAMFATELERSYAKRLTVLDYARRLGFSESSLSRASVATVGRTAKEEIDRRVALEAKRLLVHSEASTAEIGHMLGFSEPTNFVKFFKRAAGRTPLDFRRAHVSV